MTGLGRFVALITALIVGTATSSFAQDGAEFALELNNAADTTDGSCRLTFVASNRLGTAMAEVAYEVAVFDANGIVSRILVLELGALSEGKTKVLQFDLAGQQCTNTSRMIVNAVAACTQEDGTVSADLCLSNLAAASRGAIQFGI